MDFFSMETAEDAFAKQYNEQNDDTDPLGRRDRPERDCYRFIQPYIKPCHEEPIDLTQNQSKGLRSNEAATYNSQEAFMVRNIQQASAPFPMRARNHRNFCGPMYSFSPPLPEGGQFDCALKDVMQFPTNEAKQVEILRAAKSLFSKRTRTLYHWMYPNISKQQIKVAVANSWDNLGIQEKKFYVSQVLVRFGYPQCNLMVNPQLGGIKELPPLLDTYDDCNNYPPNCELQTAISSISGFGSAAVVRQCQETSRRKQGRPPGSKNKTKKPISNGKDQVTTYKFVREFQDDPELSSELEKFASHFDSVK